MFQRKNLVKKNVVPKKNKLETPVQSGALSADYKVGISASSPQKYVEPAGLGLFIDRVILNMIVSNYHGLWPSAF